MDALYSVAEILRATGGRALNVPADWVFGVSIDSREISQGTLFVAIKGARFDGHDFVRQAINAGAVAALVSEDKASGLEDLPLIVVPDALQGLTDLARAARTRSQAHIIAVTGSAGKTSTKEAIRQILENSGKTHASIRSFNNHWGVPLMLARMPRDTQFGVFEIGMSAPGEIAPLSRLVRPDIAVITAIAPAHLENFENVAGIARAKAEIFEGVEPQGWAIINADHSEIDILRQAAKSSGVRKVVTYGYGDETDVRIEEPQPDNGGMKSDVQSGTFNATVRVPTAGKHRMADAVAALLASVTAGADPEVALGVLAKLAEPDGRGAILRLGAGNKRLIVIDESYNANPASMAAALDVFAGMNTDPASKVLVLGDMLELGRQSPDLHKLLAEAVKKVGAKRIYLIGEQMRYLAQVMDVAGDLVHADRIEDVVEDILNSLDYNDAVMIKGSNSMRLGSLVSRIRDRFGAANTA